MADDDRNTTTYRSSPPTHWNQFPIHPHSHHGTPAQEYPGFNFASPHMPMEPSAFATNIQHRSLHQQLQPLVMPQWPSMLNSQQTSTFQPIYGQPVQPMSMAQLQTPVSATSTRSTSTPRKTLTDLDRKRMCQYAEEHPNSKQTEIGGELRQHASADLLTNNCPSYLWSRTEVRRQRHSEWPNTNNVHSTVSKVLRQKEKYLCQEDGSRSPVKRAKGRSPDIERALAVWARNRVCIETDQQHNVQLTRYPGKEGQDADK